jgi:hypothetical protein
MVSCPVPGWVQILQALAVPVIAAVGAWVAIQQMRIARIKLQHDLYDRRYAVFQAVRRFLDEALANQLVSSETLRAFVLGTSDAEFLLPDDLAEYLARMSERARTAQSIYMVMPALLPAVSNSRMRQGQLMSICNGWASKSKGCRRGFGPRLSSTNKVDRHSAGFGRVQR